MHKIGTGRTDASTVTDSDFTDPLLKVYAAKNWEIKETSDLDSALNQLHLVGIPKLCATCSGCFQSTQVSSHLKDCLLGHTEGLRSYKTKSN